MTTMSPSEQIQLLNPADYVNALRRMNLTAQQLEILCIHLSSPNQTITARHLARALGYANWNAANLQYGKLATRLCSELGVAPNTKLSVLVEFFKSPGSDYKLQLRPSVIIALKELGLIDDKSDIQEEVGIDEVLTEGISYIVQVNAFERNPVARQKCLAHYGHSCMICNFNFAQNYGDIADGYIHVHHLKPLAEIGEEYVIDPIKDLRPLCGNCHAVVHLRKPPYSIEEMKNMMSAIDKKGGNVGK